MGIPKWRNAAAHEGPYTTCGLLINECARTPVWQDGSPALKGQIAERERCQRGGMCSLIRLLDHSCKWQSVAGVLAQGQRHHLHMLVWLAGARGWPAVVEGQSSAGKGLHAAACP